MCKRSTYFSADRYSRLIQTGNLKPFGPVAFVDNAEAAMKKGAISQPKASITTSPGGGNTSPSGHRHAFATVRCHPCQRAGRVHPQPYVLPAQSQVYRQPPAHAQVAVVVNDAAEDVPELDCHLSIVWCCFHGGCWSPLNRGKLATLRLI